MAVWRRWNLPDIMEEEFRRALQTMGYSLAAVTCAVKVVMT